MLTNICRQRFAILLLVVAGLVCSAPLIAQNASDTEVLVTPLRRAHAHNDYLHQRPLIDAIEHGFTSIEADVYLVDEKLLVAHTAAELHPERSLRRLYLEPLAKRIEQNQGHVFTGHKRQVLTLLVDIKSDALTTYLQLEKELAPYHDWLTRIDDGQPTMGAVEVVVSGNRPREAMLAQRSRVASFDGRIGDLGTDAATAFMPLISERWGSLFKWKGDGEMPPDETRRLVDLVQRTHREGRRLRFWATPESAAVWQRLVEADVDHINTDDLAGLSRFLRHHEH